MRIVRILGPVAAALVVAASGLLAMPVAPAVADPISSCAGRTGVVVVVDFNELGGGVTRGCDSASGHTAAQSFTAAGYNLTYSRAPGMAGFVCTVQGKPTDGSCTGASDYWSLWWSDGRSNTWTYSSLGADGLKVPAGGYVAFAWHEGSGKATAPDVQPSPRTASTPTPTATAHPTHSAAPATTPHPHQSAAAAAPAVTASGSASAAPGATATDGQTASAPTTAKHHRLPVETPAALPGGSPSTPTIDQISAGPPADPSAEAGAGVGTWLAVGVGVLVIAGAGAVPLLRRRRG